MTFLYPGPQNPTAPFTSRGESRLLVFCVSLTWRNPALGGRWSVFAE